MKIAVGGLTERDLGLVWSRVDSDREVAYRDLVHFHHRDHVALEKCRQVGVVMVDFHPPRGDRASCVSEA